MTNRVELTGRILESSGLRFTPAGVPAVQLRLRHASEQVEAGRPRQVGFEVEAAAFGEIARTLGREPAGATIRITGFLDRKGPRTSQLALHVTDYTLIEE